MQDFAAAFRRYEPILDDWQAFEEALKRPLDVSLWTHPHRLRPEELKALLEEDGFSPTPLDWYPGAFTLPTGTLLGGRWPFLAGLFHIQEQASMLPVCLLDPQPGERVLDMCAAPGNKSAQIGVRLQNQGSIVSNDRSKRRLQMLRRIFSRLGIANGTITARDAANYARDAGQFDKVLVDAPCSCQGNSRKMSAINQGWFRPEYSVKTSRLQRAILRKAVHKCRPGGRIVYSTCTYAPEENEAVVHDILEEMRGDGIEIVPASIPGFSTAPGLTSFEGQQWSKEMTHCMRVWPHLNDTGGFFVAVLEKKITGRAHFAMPGVTPQDNRFERFEADTVDEEAREQWAFVRERFGLDEEMLSEYQLLRPATRRMYLYPRASQGLRAPEPENQGLILMRVNGKFSKFSTDAAMFFGRKLQRNVMELNDEQLPLYLSRETCFPEAEQMERCTIGPVVIRYRGEPLGTGFWRPHEDSAAVDVEGAGELLSRFPKAWSQEYKDTAANNTGKKRQTRAPRPQKPSTPQCCPD